MIEYKVREKRDLGTNPYPNISYFTEDDEFIITQTIANIVKDDNLNVLAYNICADHIHLLLVCEEEEVSSVVQKIKSKTARAVNLHREVTTSTREQAPLPKILPLTDSTREQAPLPIKQKINSLWTQKYGCKEIVTEEHLFTAIDYIKHNRSKHHLPQHSNKGFKLLVESINCSYEHAFRAEYNGGFDVVIGNPPYVSIKILSNTHKEYYLQKFKTAIGQFDLYILFYEQGYNLIKINGILSFITYNT
ncbi:MAG: transposase, partial [Flavobacteriaceae bacterium]|nr:transposase [Flavobacteriaceae bacterium]